MTPEKLEALWQQGQQQEAQGSLDAARASYVEILAGSPRQIMVKVKLSEIEQRAGHYRAARKFALQASDTIALTRRWEGLPHVTANLLVFDERHLVRQLIEEADWNDARIIRQSPVLSQQLWMCGAEESALRLLDRAGGRGAADHRLAYSRAMALQQLGRIEEATAALEECIRLAPGFAPAHWSLAYHEPSPAPGARIDRIRAAASMHHQELERAMLHYALYKELDGADEREAAWTELEKGAAIMRATLGVPAQALPGGAIPKPETGASTLQPGAVGDHTPIFIVGMPRTGTTLLSRIVGANPVVADAGELNALEQAVDEALDRFVDFPLQAADIARLCGDDAAVVAEGYMRRTRRYCAGQATHLIDKNPMNVFASEVIARSMPHARILCLSRGAMDTCYSNLRQLFQNGAFAYSYDQRRLAERYVAFRREVDALKERLPATFLEVSYESLVEDPVRTSKAVMAFCSLDFDPRFAEITRNTSPSATASNSQIRGPIHLQAVGAWRRYEDKLRPLMNRLDELGVAV